MRLALEAVDGTKKRVLQGRIGSRVESKDALRPAVCSGRSVDSHQLLLLIVLSITRTVTALVSNMVTGGLATTRLFKRYLCGQKIGIVVDRSPTFTAHWRAKWCAIRPCYEEELCQSSERSRQFSKQMPLGRFCDNGLAVSREVPTLNRWRYGFTYNLPVFRPPPTIWIVVQSWGCVFSEPQCDWGDAFNVEGEAAVSYLEVRKRRPPPSVIGHFGAASAGAQGVVRLINSYPDVAAHVAIRPFDDSGVRYEELKVTVGGGQAVHVNSDDLEFGNPAKGLSMGTGSGSGDWQLELDSDQDIETVSFCP